jgi:hypothetical protein
MPPTARRRLYTQLLAWSTWHCCMRHFAAKLLVLIYVVHAQDFAFRKHKKALMRQCLLCVAFPPPPPFPAVMAVLLLVLRNSWSLGRESPSGKDVGAPYSETQPGGAGVAGSLRSPSQPPSLPPLGGGLAAARKPALYLVALTTCNHWWLSKTALDNLMSLTDSIDVVVVDDNSEDGTAAEARALGYRVLAVRGGCPPPPRPPTHTHPNVHPNVRPSAVVQGCQIVCACRRFLLWLPWAIQCTVCTCAGCVRCEPRGRWTSPRV